MWLNWPNRITIARIVLVAPLVICLLHLNDSRHDWRHIALMLFCLMAFSDALDGFLARRLHAATQIGRFLDPIADKLLITCAVILLSIDATAVHGYQLPSWVPVIALGKDILTVIGFVLVYMATGRFFVEPRFWGKACTTIQLLMVAYVLLAPDLPDGWNGLLTALAILSSALAVIALADYIRLGNRFVSSRQHAFDGASSHERTVRPD